MQKHLHDYYVSCNKDFLNTVSVIFIDKQTLPTHFRDNSNGDIWRHILLTNAPYGLNIADCI